MGGWGCLCDFCLQLCPHQLNKHMALSWPSENIWGISEWTLSVSQVLTCSLGAGGGLAEMWVKGERQSLRILGWGRGGGGAGGTAASVTSKSGCLSRTALSQCLCLYTDVSWFLHSSWLNMFFSIGPKIQFKREKKYSEGIGLMS